MTKCVSYSELWIPFFSKLHGQCLFFLANFCDATTKVATIWRKRYSQNLAIYTRYEFSLFPKGSYYYILDCLLEIIIRIWWFRWEKNSNSVGFGSSFFFFFGHYYFCKGLNHIFQVKIWLKFARKKITVNLVIIFFFTNFY